MNKKILMWIGLYLIADGLISIIYFKATASWWENFFRWIRVGIGLYLYWRMKKWQK